jgi:hypothetical protein
MSLHRVIAYDTPGDMISFAAVVIAQIAIFQILHSEAVEGDVQKKSLGLARADGRFSKLALLASDQCPYSIKAAIFAGTAKETFKDRKEFSGSVFRQIDEILAYLNVYNKVASVFEGAYHVDRTDYPEIVFREALINAVIHRDYYIDGSILVSMFADRTEIMSLWHPARGHAGTDACGHIRNAQRQTRRAVFSAKDHRGLRHGHSAHLRDLCAVWRYPGDTGGKWRVSNLTSESQRHITRH